MGRKFKRPRFLFELNSIGQKVSRNRQYVSIIFYFVYRIHCSVDQEIGISAVEVERSMSSDAKNSVSDCGALFYAPPTYTNADTSFHGDVASNKDADKSKFSPVEE